MANTKTYFDTLVSATSAEDSALIVIQTQSNSDLNTMKKIDLGSVRQPTNDKIASSANAITAEEERAKASEASYASEASSALAGESSRAQASEASLATSVTSETSRAVSTENIISANLLAEYSRAKASEASLATKITTSINALDVSEIGENGAYISRVEEEDGKILASATSFDRAINANSTDNNAPTSLAVKKLIESLDVALVGSDSATPKSVITSIKEEDGKIIATFANVATSISNNPNTIPTTQAVYNMEQSAILAALGALDYQNGYDGYYIKKIKQEDGQIEVTLQKFDTYNKNQETWSSSVSNNNIPTTQAVEDRVMIEAASRASAIEALDYTSVGSAGSFVQKVDETDGVISETIVAFENGTLASYTSSNAASYSGRTDVAPTVKAVTDQVKRLDQRIDALDYTSVGSDGYFIQKVSQTDGKISEVKKAFENGNIKNSSDTTTAPTVKAVADQVERLDQRVDDEIASRASVIEALDYVSSGAAGSFVQKVSQTDGKIQETVVAFFNDNIKIDEDTYSSNADVAPTVDAVAREVKRLDQIAAAIGGDISALTCGVVGGSGKYVKSIRQDAGLIIPVADSFASSIAASTTAASNNVAPTEHAVREAINALDYVSSGAAGSYVQKVEEDDGIIKETIVKFDTYDSSSEAWSSTPTDNNVPSTLAVKKVVEQEAAARASAINALDVSSVGSNGYYLKTIKETDGKISATKQKFDTYNSSSRAWVTGPSDNNAPTSQAVEDRIEEAKRQIIQETEAMVYLGAVVSLANLKDKAEHSGREYHYLEGDTYIANGEFNLDDSASPSSDYEVNIGDFIIVKYGVKSDIYNKDNFDIVGGSKRAIMFDGSSAASGNFLMFSNESGINAIDSGENAGTLNARVVAASESAAAAAISAACSASSADFAWGQAEPFVIEAACAASKAQSSSDAAVSAKAGAQAASTAAVSAKTGAQAASTAAVSAQTGAQAASDAAVFAKTGAQAAKADAETAKIAAVSAQTGAQAASTAAVSAKTGAQAASTAAVSAKTGAQAASAAAVSAQARAEAAESAAVIAKTGAQAASTAAVSAQTGAQAASDAAVSAQTGAEAAKNAAVSAKNAAVSAQTGAQAASDAAVSAQTGAQAAKNAAEAAKNTAVSAQTGAQAAKNAAVSAQTGAEAAYNAAVSAQTGAEGSSDAAVAAMTGAQDASDAAVSAQTGAEAAESAAKTSKNNAADYESAANTAAINAAAAKADAEAAKNTAVSAQTGAQDAKNAAVSAQTGAEAAYNAAVSAQTGAEDSAAKAAQFASDANLYEIKAACEEAAYIASSAVSNLTFATQTKAGIVSTAAQTFGGVKTFNNGIAFGSTGGSISSSGGATFAGTVTANDFEAVSSRKLKENIKPTLVSALDLIETVKVVDFNYINDDEKTPHIGFIAEDTDKLLSTPHQNKMDYTNCIGTLLKAVQEITKGMKELREEIEKLK